MALDPITAALDFGSKIIDKIFPDKDKADAAKLELLKLQQGGQLQEMANEAGLLKDQSAVNLEEAKSSNMFIAGWRPFIGWVCGSGLLYSVLVRPILVTFGAKAPDIDIAVLMNILVGMLGLAGYRTWEKVKKVNS